MHMENLNRMADFLDTVPSASFDLLSWRRDVTPRPVLSFLGGPDCGTTACAVGSAADAGIFPGLQLLKRNATEQKRGRRIKEYALSYHKPGGKKYHGWEAVDRLFETTAEESDMLFHPDFYTGHATPAMVAGRIRDMVEKAKSKTVNVVRLKSVA